MMSKVVFVGKKFDAFKKDLDKVLKKHYPNNDYKWEHYVEEYGNTISESRNGKINKYSKWLYVRIDFDSVEIKYEL